MPYLRNGDKIHVCKHCQRLPKNQRRAIENQDEICGFMQQCHISKKNIARLEKLVKSQEPEVACLAAREVWASAILGATKGPTIKIVMFVDLEEGTTELPQTEDSKTTDLPAPEDWEIPF